MNIELKKTEFQQCNQFTLIELNDCCFCVIK
jgi:hypothetical protein